MKTKAITLLLTSICFTSLSLKVHAQDRNSIAKEVREAVSDSLQAFKQSGQYGLTEAVSNCWNEPRDYCLYLDSASHGLAVGSTYSGTVLHEYFHKTAVSNRGHAWLSPNGRGQAANDEYLRTVKKIMGCLVIAHKDKMFNDRP